MNLLTSLKFANLVLEGVTPNSVNSLTGKPVFRDPYLYRIMHLNEIDDMIENRIWRNFSEFEDDLIEAEAEARAKGIPLQDYNKYKNMKEYPYFKSFSRVMSHFQEVAANRSPHTIIVKFSRKGLASIPNTELTDFLWHGDTDEEQEERLCAKKKNIRINPEQIIAGFQLVPGADYSDEYDKELIGKCVDLVGPENVTMASVRRTIKNNKML